mmetsp:Transcript_3314/g.7257  ORF Transcript_3314/g.7257 Transcript_3314/m.7257 type:complete len:148 (-) Transcript_3314:261-704(-)
MSLLVKAQCVRPFSSSVPAARVPARPTLVRYATSNASSQRVASPRSLVIRSSSDADKAIAPAGQMSSALMQSMSDKIKEALETDRVVVKDMYGDGRHVSIDVVSDAFEGKNAVQRQRMVYKAIWLELQEAVHAVDSMTTLTAAEAGK